MADDFPSPAPSPTPSPSSSSGASPSPSSPHSKRRRTDQYALGFEFAPRLAPYEMPSPEVPHSRGSPEWTEGSTFALLDAWGDRFVRAGPRGIRADEWLEVARLASAAASRPAGYYSESQCRNRIDTLRKKFRKEKERARLAGRRSRTYTSKWVYFDKMASVLCPPPPPIVTSRSDTDPLPLPLPLLSPVVTRPRDTQPSRRRSWGVNAPEHLLGGGVDPGPENSGSYAELAKPQFEVAEPQKIGSVARNSSGFAALTESIQKFGEVFERMEGRKKQYMVEVEQMRRDFRRDLDARWREILEKAKTEIASLEDDDGDEDAEEEGDGGDDNKRIGGGGGEEQNNGVMDASP